MVQAFGVRRTSTLASRVEGLEGFGSGGCRQIRSGPLLFVPLLTSLRFPCGAVAPRSLRSFATLHTTSMSVVGHAAPKKIAGLVPGLPGIPLGVLKRTPALCPRTTTVACLRRPWPGKAAFFLLAAFVNSRVVALTAGCSTLRTRGCKRQAIATSTRPKGWNV